MRVKIIKATLPSFWYAGQIGSEFNVEEHTHDKYKLIKDVTLSSTISKSDCEILPEENPQPEPFDLERAKAGDPVITINGKSAKYISTISKGRKEPMHIFEVTTGLKDDTSWPYCYASNGCYQSGEGIFNETKSDNNNMDLLMAPKEPQVVTRWVNIYHNLNHDDYNCGVLFSNEYSAFANGKTDKGFIKTIPITFTI